ncbi:MAG TPA: 30S ribosomal protein S20 [Candidatus Acidoferrum sp.]|nr:30S ribosomal protein S20 [Candidatus Acidoferrum sp.]
MPIIKSAIKRMHQTAKRHARNVATKRGLRSAVKAFTLDKAAKNLSAAQSEIDKAVKKNLLSKNAAARKKAQLAKIAKEVGTKHAPKKTAAVKAAEKKVATKVATPKVASKPKTAAKKAAE